MFFFFYPFFQVEDEVDEVSKTEFDKLEAKLGERDGPVGSDSSAPTKGVQKVITSLSQGEDLFRDSASIMTSIQFLLKNDVAQSAYNGWKNNAADHTLRDEP